MSQDMFVVDIRPGSSSWKADDVDWFKSLVADQLPLRDEVLTKQSAQKANNNAGKANSHEHKEEVVDVKCIGYATLKAQLASSSASPCAATAPALAGPIAGSCNKKSKHSCIYGYVIDIDAAACHR
jgi:hypothetical protein